jgi:hypothetical protein
MPGPRVYESTSRIENDVDDDDRNELYVSHGQREHFLALAGTN